MIVIDIGANVGYYSLMAAKEFLREGFMHLSRSQKLLKSLKRMSN
jgi:hypothetical protein